MHDTILDSPALLAQLMDRAVHVARCGIASGQSPFGAVVATRQGDVICEAHNTVRAETDATAHAEVNAIRHACRKLGTIDLSGHIMITTCEPCPMCASAIHWARCDAVVYGATIEDAAKAGFHELSLGCAKLYQSGGSEVRIVSDIMRAPCAALFDDWLRGAHAQPY